MKILELYNNFKASTGISTDTRSINIENSLFFCLKGYNFDGNLFALDAVNKGCKLAIVDNKNIALQSSKILFVNNVLKTLQNLASYHRTILNLPIISITGSNGKTTTKELLTLALSSKYNVYSTKGNLNNHIGVPLSILQITSKHEIAVLELGDSKLGDITKLCQICKPNYGLITNIGLDHIGGFGSIKNNILAKREIIDYLIKSNEYFFLNAKEKVFKSIVLNSNLKTILYNENNSFSVKSQTPYLSYKYNDKTYRTKMFGEYNLENIKIVFKIAQHFNIKDSDIHKKICNYKPYNNRSQIIETKKNTIILDAYNANPSSVQMVLVSFYKINNLKKCVFLGDMSELGEISNEEHDKIITLVSKMNFSKVFLIGSNFMKSIQSNNILYFENKIELIKHITSNKIIGYYILLKGSRSMKLETLIDYL